MAKLTGTPPTSSSPALGDTAPAMIFTSVDLPEPFLPISAWMRPGSKRCVNGASASVAP